MTSRISVHRALLLLLASVTASACNSIRGVFEAGLDPNNPPRFEVLVEAPTFTTEAGTGKQAFLEFKDLEDVPELKQLKTDIAEELKKRGITVTENSEGVDYLCQICLRYFNINAKGNGGQSVVEAAASIGGGRKGWIDAGSTVLEGPKPWLPVNPILEGKHKEWCLVLELSVGEKGGEPRFEQDYAWRTGRILFYIESRGVGREEALWLFKYGLLPPVPIENDDTGVVTMSHPGTHSDPPKRLLETLVPNLLPLVH